MKKNLFIIFVFVFLLAGCGQGDIAPIIPIDELPENANAALNQPVAANLNAPVVSNSGATLVKVLISDVADSNGSVEIGKSTFAAETPELAVSAYILKAEQGLKVTAIMTYLVTGDKVGPVNNDTQIAGDIISNFLFSKPTTGWPSGDYAVSVTLSDGQAMTINFNIP